ncbi:MAG: LytTR family transcriptional regulator [Bacteroidales bacterium]|nr:LytTR family transcriptional regulator [Bacteroidales bacterium]
MDKIIIIDDSDIKKELEAFLDANKNHIRLHSDMDEFSLGKNPLLNEIITQYEEKHKIKIRSKDYVGFYRSSDIIRFEEVGSKTIIHLADGMVNEINEDLDIIEKQLQDFPFIRTHPKHIINIHSISKISKHPTNAVELNNGCLIPITDHLKNTIIEMFNKYFK